MSFKRYCSDTFETGIVPSGWFLGHENILRNRYIIVNQMYQWIDDNITGRWCVKLNNSTTVLIYFEFEEDMVAYKLRWL